MTDSPATKLTQSMTICPGYVATKQGHPAHLVITVHGPVGAVSAEFNLGYYAYETLPAHGLDFVGFVLHSRVQLSHDTTPTHEFCQHLSGPCFSESWGSGTTMLDILTLQGSSGVYEVLEEIYNDKLQHAGENWSI